MYNRILVGIDFSKASLESAHWAAKRFPDAEIVLLHAIAPLAPPSYVKQALGPELDLSQGHTLDASENLRHLREELGERGPALVEDGWAPEVINRAAIQTAADLVVIAAHQKRVYPWHELGERCVAIVKQATRPSLVWRKSTGDHEETTILAAVDLREGSPPVAATAAEYARHFGGRLVLLHALPTYLQAYLRAVSTPVKVDETFKALEEGARAAALSAIPAETREGLDISVKIVRGKSIVSHVLTAAVTEGADLIVIGKHYAPNFAGLTLLGGTTGRVIRGANCSVLTLPT